MLTFAITVGLASAFTPSQDPNMNGAYRLSKTPGAPADIEFPTNFKDYPGGVFVSLAGPPSLSA